MSGDRYGRDRVLPKHQTVEELRCWRCEKLLAEQVTTPYRFTCPRCSAKVEQEEPRS